MVFRGPDGDPGHSPLGRRYQVVVVVAKLVVVAVVVVVAAAAVIVTMTHTYVVYLQYRVLKQVFVFFQWSWRA